MSPGENKPGHALPSSTPQSQPPPKTIASNKMPLPAWMISEEKRNHLLKQYRIPAASAVSTVLATISVTPLENLKTRMQTHDFRGVRHCAQYLWRTEGFRGYTAGAIPPLFSITAVRVINFTVYQRVKHAISDAVERATGESPLAVYNTPGSMPTLSTISCFMLSGMVAGLAAAPLACPFELAKNVVQTSVLINNRSHASSEGAKLQSLRHVRRLGTLEAITQIIARHGFRGLYAGIRLHATRDCIGTGLYFSIYETGKQLMAKYLGEDHSSIWSSMAAGALCGVLPWFVTYSLDTRKTRAQSLLLGKAKEIGEASMSAARSSIYKGLSVILCRTAVQNMILLTTFEHLKARIAALE